MGMADLDPYSPQILIMKAGPDYIQFYPTLRCNRSCAFCFNRSMPAVPDMRLGDYAAMLRVLKNAGVRTVDMIGGEPTMHPDIVLFIKEALQRGFSVNISSNGSNLDSLKVISGLGQGVTVGISVNDRESLDQVRGYIQQYGPVVKTIFGPRLDRAMIGQILSLGPERFYLIYRDVLDQDDCRAAVPFHRFKSEVEKNFDPGQVGMVYCSGFLPDTIEYPDLARVRCPAGTTKLGVLPDGSVYPCNLFFGSKDHYLGNVLTDPFPDLWNHRALTFFRTFAGNSCPIKSCELHAGCHGGCPAHSFFFTGKLSEADPRCGAN
jgi:radical SAM protein with 4Fe4S-binding SPASM domain